MYIDKAIAGFILGIVTTIAIEILLIVIAYKRAIKTDVLEK